MADPLSILGGLATAGQLIEMTIKIAKDLNDVRKRYTVRMLRNWIREAFKNEVDERYDDLLTALTAFQPSLKALRDEVDRICSTASAESRFGPLALSRKKKLKYLWNEDNMKMYLENVRWQAMNLHLLLSATKFSVKDSTEKIRQVAIATSVRFPPLDGQDAATIAPSTFGGATINDRSFPGLDDILINSSTYRATLERANNIVRANNQSSMSESTLTSSKTEEDFGSRKSGSIGVTATRLESYSSSRRDEESRAISPSVQLEAQDHFSATSDPVSEQEDISNGDGSAIENETDDGSKISELSDEEDDDDDLWDYGHIGFDLLEISVLKGHELFSRGFWSEAEPFLLRSLELFNSGDVNYVVSIGELNLDRRAVELELALTYRHQSRWEEASKALTALAEPFLAKDIDLTSALSEGDLLLLHNLAACQLRLGQPRMAEKTCGVALKGRRAIFGKDHPLCHESTTLLVQIVQIRGNLSRAAVFATLLPNNSIYHVDNRDRAQSILKSIGQDMGAPDFGAMECLRAAVVKGKVDAVELLLGQVDVYPNSIDAAGKTILHYAAVQKEDAIIKTLLTLKDIRLDVQDKEGLSPLMCASKESMETSVRVLLAKSGVEESLNSQDNFGNTALHHIAAVGDGQILRRLLSRRDVHVNLSTKEEALTPLMIAADRNHTIAVRLLLSRDDIEVNKQNSLGKTALSIACRKGFSGVTKLLLDHPQVDVNIPDGKRWTPLHHAIYERYTAVVKMLLERRDTDINVRHEISRPLHMACINGMTEVVRMLVERPELEINKESVQGWTPLHSACAAKPENSEVVGQLLQRNEIQVNLTTDKDWSPLNTAATHGQVNITSLLLERKDIAVNSSSNTGQTALYSAASKNHFEVVKQLLKYPGIDVNQPVYSGWTPLNVAVGDCSFETVKVLLKDPRVDVNHKTVDGYTPLCVNALKKRNDIARLLLARDDIDVNIASNDGSAPINRAASSGNTELVEMLLKRKELDFDHLNSYLASPLYLAAGNGHADVVKALLAVEGINVNRLQKNNWSPLNTASVSGHTEVVRLLVALPDVQVNLKENGGMAALSNAAKNGHLEVVKLLLGRKDIDVNLATDKGWCAVGLAADAGHYDTVVLLSGVQGINLAVGEDKGVSAMQCAVKKSHTKIVTYLKTRLKLP